MDEEYPLMAFIANIGVAPKGDRYDRSALVHDEKGKKYKRTEKGDFIYSSNNLETGSIGLNNYGNACISPVYSIFKSKHTVDPEFMGRILLRKEFINQMVSFRQGVVYGQWKIHEDDFLNLDILVPQTTEQQKIGGFFSELDKIITLHQREYFAFDFNSRSAKIAQNTLSWEQRKLGDMCDEFQSGKSIKASDITDSGEYAVYGGNGFRGYTDTYNHDGDYALIGRQGALCGNMNFSSGKAYFTEHAVAVQGNADNDTLFLYYLLDLMNLGQYSGQSAQPGLAVNKIIQLYAKAPKMHEQKQISSFFKQLDTLITLHQHKPNKKGHDVLTVMPFKGNQRKPHYLCT